MMMLIVRRRHITKSIQKPWTLSWSRLTRPVFFNQSRILRRWSPCSCKTSPYSLCSITVPLQANSFLHALRIFLRSYSEERPWMVVRVFLPFLCWIRMWTKPSWTSFSPPFAASAKGSEKKRKKRCLGLLHHRKKHDFELTDFIEVNDLVGHTIVIEKALEI